MDRFLRNVWSIASVVFLILMLPINVYAASSASTQSMEQTGAVTQAAVSAGQSEVSTAKWNVMLLIDTSGSMNDTDPDHMTLSAANQFVDDMSNSDLTQSSGIDAKVGVMTFSNDTTSLVGLTSIGSENNKSSIKNAISSIQYTAYGTGSTDLGVAVYNAAQALKEENKNNDSNSEIVLFTDGFSERVADPAASEEKLQNAFQTAKELNCNIYVIGMNSKNKILPEGQQEIEKIADTAQVGDGVVEPAMGDTSATKSKVNYLITDNYDSARAFYVGVYANMMGVVSEPLKDGKFTIDSGGIVEADVNVSSQYGISSIKITDPNGTELKEDGQLYSVSGDNNYKVAKIIKPALGEYTVTIESNDPDVVSAMVVKLYGIEIKLSAEAIPNEDSSQTGITDSPYVGKVSVTPTYKGNSYKDSEFAGSINKAEFMLNAETNSYSLTYDDASGNYIGFFPASDGTYEITATLANEKMSRTAECKLDVKNGWELKDGRYSYDLGTIKVKRGTRQNLDLSSLINNTVLKLQSVQVGDPQQTVKKNIVTAEADQNNIVITGKNVGEDVFSATATDKDNKTWNLSGKVEVSFGLFLYEYIIIAALAVLLVLAIYFLIKKLKMANGIFYMELINLEDNSSVDSDISGYPRGDRFSLWKLAEIAIRQVSAENKKSAEDQKILDIVKNEKNKISEREIVIARAKTVNGEVYKTYKLKNHNKLSILDGICYQSKNLEMRLSFKPFSVSNGFGGESRTDKKFTPINKGGKKGLKTQDNNGWGK